MQGTELSAVDRHKARLVLTPFFVQRWEQVTLIKTFPEDICLVSQDILNFWYILKWMLSLLPISGIQGPPIFTYLLSIFPSIRAVHLLLHSAHSLGNRPAVGHKLYGVHSKSPMKYTLNIALTKPPYGQNF